MDTKLHQFFEGMIVYKGERALASLKIQSFLRDWLLQKFTSESGEVDIEQILAFIKKNIPTQDQWVSLKARIVAHEPVKLLTKLQVDVCLKTGEPVFSLPIFGLSQRESYISDAVWSEYRDSLCSTKELWGQVILGYKEGDAGGKVTLEGFHNFCPYTVDLPFYQNASKNFTISEWIDVLLGAIDVDADAYPSEEAKLALLSRLLPFVEKNLNIIELAPKGTGKSYLFGNISRYGMLVDGGRISRASMFFNNQTKTPGFLMNKDYVAIDEVKLVNFGSDLNEMRSIMQGYMASGRFNFNGHEHVSDAGVVFLGNIAQSRMNENKYMLAELPSLFQESALLDRIHGFIRGWDIPPYSTQMTKKGWALNTEFFSTIMHLLRSDESYRFLVERMVRISDQAYARHTEAVLRIATAYMKLLFPYAVLTEDLDPELFNTYCLQPAIRMRSIILKQLQLLDGDEYGKPNKAMPEFFVKGME